jgi:hypothetical protein
MHHVRSKQVFALCFVILTGFVAARAQADSVGLSFVPVSTEVACDEARPIDVWIDDSVTDLRGASLVMRFDPQVIRPVAVEEGQLFVDAPCPPFLRWNNATSIGDSVFVDVAGLGCSVQGPGPILRVWVTGVADGSTLLWGTAATLRDGANVPMTALWTPAHIIVACPIKTQVGSWAALKASFR